MGYLLPGYLLSPTPALPKNSETLLQAGSSPGLSLGATYLKNSQSLSSEATLLEPL
jgi:hypothetical protein